MSLFQQLLKLHSNNPSPENPKTPLENFFTEIVAHLFRTNHSLLLDWFRNIQFLDADDYLGISVTTQKTYQHPTTGKDKIPDIIIELVSHDTHDIIFVENKIGSKEEPNQLPDYAKILDSLSGYQNRLLLYITRDFEPKKQDYVLSQVSGTKIKFNQLRWHQLYQFLNKLQQQSDLVKEIIQFMQEYRMAQNNQFSAIDVLALANFQSPLKLMEQTMWGKTVQKFEEVLDSHKNINFRKRRALQNIQWHNRYIMGAWMPEKWWCHLGFLLRPYNNYNSYDYSVVRLVLEIDPKSPHRKSTIQAFEKICEQFDWRGYSLHNINDWAHITLAKSLRDFLVEEDHIAAIEKFFLDALDQLQEIKNQYPELPWGAVPEDDEDSEEA
jgi:hypothetical protein